MLIDHVQHAHAAAIVRPRTHEVVAPHMTRMHRPEAVLCALGTYQRYCPIGSRIVIQFMAKVK
jgi:hypothetical protein